ncbi:hypothetical protein TrCOL_g11488 [Triparma columacea]|nr:hypothetical protein TrCOL_g11488 [Triparma columacea]
MHRDIDETHGKTLPPVPPFGDVEVSKDDFHYPAFGHVLYCGIEGDDELVNGAGGTVLLSSSSNTTTQHSTNLFVVPPRPGRLLRFKGDLMHGVPRPALSYFNSDEISLLGDRRRREGRVQRSFKLSVHDDPSNPSLVSTFAFNPDFTPKCYDAEEVTLP